MVHNQVEGVAQKVPQRHLLPRKGQQNLEKAFKIKSLKGLRKEISEKLNKCNFNKQCFPNDMKFVFLNGKKGSMKWPK